MLPLPFYLLSKTAPFRAVLLPQAAAALHGISVTLLFLVDPVAEQKKIRTAAAAASAPAAAGATGTEHHQLSRPRRLSTPMFPGDASQPAATGAGTILTSCDCCTRSWLGGVVVCLAATVGAAMALFGVACMHEAIAFGLPGPTKSNSTGNASHDNATAAANMSGADMIGLRLCGEVSTELVPGALAVWHHGVLLGFALLVLGAFACTCSVGLAWRRRSLRGQSRHLGLQRQGGVKPE
eukprot:SAG22_NODE_64_length_23238_cov_83.185566_9_plen_238_part_00